MKQKGKETFFFESLFDNLNQPNDSNILKENDLIIFRIHYELSRTEKLKNTV